MKLPLSKVYVNQNHVILSPKFEKVSVRPLRSVSDHDTKWPTLNTANRVPDHFGSWTFFSLF